MRICERSSCADSKVKEEGEARGAPGARDEISLQPMVQPVVKPCYPAVLGDQWGAESHLQPMDTATLEQWDAQRR